MRGTALQIIEEIQTDPSITSARQYYLTSIRDCIALFYMASTFSQVSPLNFIKG